MKEIFNISVVVAIYNPNWNNLEKTLYSILLQEKVKYEIIIADDGSEYSFQEEINKYFNKYDFVDFVYDYSEVNQGTCSNVIRGIKHARGEYIKLISPGDFLYSKNTLKEWYDFNLINNCKMSFGNAVYYRLNENLNIEIVNIKNNPADLTVYEKNANKNNIKENYLVFNDLALGSTFLVNTILMKEYILLLENKVKYAEDNVYRLMIADGVSIQYFSQNILWYEYGNGISTQKSNKWEQLLKKDFDITSEIILKQIKPKDSFTKKYIKYLQYSSNKQKLIKLILFPRSLLWKFHIKFKPTLTTRDVDLNNIIMIIKGD